MKGQLSAEMLVVLVIVLGLAVLLASTMFKSASKAGEEVDKRTGAAFSAGAGKLPAGSPCTKNSDCASESCDIYLGKCT